MAAPQPIDYILSDCFLAVGQAVGTQKPLDPEAIGWWRERYRAAFLSAMARGNSWERDRQRVMAVGRFLGERALFHAADRSSIDRETAQLASTDVETGCQMNAVREGVLDLRTAVPSSQLVS
jgi:hypothetical protein